MSFLQTLYFGNTILNYVIALSILAGSIIGGKIVYWMITNVIMVFTKKTQTKLDDILIDSLKGPSVFFMFYLGFNYSYRTLILGERAFAIFGNIAYILLAINISWIILNLIDSIIKEYFTRLADKTKTELDNQLLPVIRTLTKVMIIVITLIAILDNMGLDVASLLAGLGIGGLAFALAAQDSLKNFFGGVAVFTDKPFKVGDRIKLDEQRDGFVREIGVRSTKLETFDGTYIIVPNARMADTVLENISMERARRIRMTLGLEYGTTTKKMERAIEIIKKIVKDNKDTDDKSIVVFNEFGESSLNLLVIYWIKNLDNILNAKHNVNISIKKQFDKEKISIAFPSRTLYMRKEK